MLRAVSATSWKTFCGRVFTRPGHERQDLYVLCNGMHVYTHGVSFYTLFRKRQGLPTLLPCRNQVTDTPAGLVTFPTDE